MTVDWKGIGKGLIIADLVLVNVASGYLIYKSQISNLKSQISPNDQTQNSKQDIENRLLSLKQEILAEVQIAGSSATPVPTITSNQSMSIPKTLTKPKIKTVAYVTIPGSGRSGSFDWGNLAGTDFYFDTRDYPGLLEAYFEASMNLFNGNGRAYVRLFDVTHSIGVQGSQVETTNQASTVVESGKLSFWAGKNTYRVQAKTLTSDTAIFSYGRLRIVTEN